ncbi:MAG: hypothetical protein ACYC3F_09480 [Gemmatimonadaceae bacterium]
MSSYDIDLDTRIQAAIDEFRDAREEALRKVEGGADILRMTGTIADVVLRVADELVVRGGFDGQATWESMRTFLTPGPGGDLVREEMRMALARELLPDTERMSWRAINITEKVLSREPNQSVLRFMRRLTRCYIAGFDSECVMCCRAVLDNAVNEVLDALALQPKRNRQNVVTMKGKLDALEAVGRLTAQSCKTAADLWLRGSEAVHNDPKVAGEVEETIDWTITVLQDLYRAPLPARPPAQGMD